MDIINCCRTCLCQEPNLYSLFDHIKTEEPLLSNILMEITSINISEDDPLPNLICGDCKEKAHNAFEFKKNSLKSQTTLLEFVNKDEKSFVAKINQEDVKVEYEEPHDKEDDTDFGREYETDIDKDYDTDIDVELVKIEEQYNPLRNGDGVSQRPNGDNTMANQNDAFVRYKLIRKIKTLDKNKTKNQPDKHLMRAFSKEMTIKRPATVNFSQTDVKAGSHVCIFCKNKFGSETDCVSHIVSFHRERKLFHCLICKMNYPDVIYYEKHKCGDDDASQTEDNTVRPFQPKSLENLREIPQKEFWDPENYVKGGDLLLKCKYCHAIYKQRTELITHIHVAHQEHSVICNLCNKEFATRKSAVRHTLKCKKVEKRFKCLSCHVKFPCELSLNKHILRSHVGQNVSVNFIGKKDKKTENENNSQQYRCNQCDKSFVKKYSLERHIINHAINSKIFECDTCHRRFHKKGYLRVHMRMHDPNYQDKNSQSKHCLCVYCGKGFSNSSNLIVHVRRHTGEKPYKCDFCGKGFPRSSDLTCHRRMHTGEKTCACPVCGKEFSRSNKLSRHMRVHTGQKPYKCTYCEKAFSQSNDLTLHVRRHTGDKPYGCEVCGERFIQKSALQNHRRSMGHFPATTTSYEDSRNTYLPLINS